MDNLEIPEVNSEYAAEEDVEAEVEEKSPIKIEESIPRPYTDFRTTKSFSLTKPIGDDIAIPIPNSADDPLSNKLRMKRSSYLESILFS